MNKAHVQHLEPWLLALAKDAKHPALDNLNYSAVPYLSEKEFAFAENFLHQMLLTLPLLSF